MGHDRGHDRVHDRVREGGAHTGGIAPAIVAGPRPSAGRGCAPSSSRGGGGSPASRPGTSAGAAGSALSLHRAAVSRRTCTGSSSSGPSRPVLSAIAPGGTPSASPSAPSPAAPKATSAPEAFEAVRGFARRQAADHEDPGRRPVAHRPGGHVAAAPGQVEDGDERPAHPTSPELRVWMISSSSSARSAAPPAPAAPK